MPIRTALFATALLLACTPVSTAVAQDEGLAGPPAGMHAAAWTPDAGPGAWRPDQISHSESWRWDSWRRDGWRDAATGSSDSWRTTHEGRSRREAREAKTGHSGECWAQVRYAAQYAPPPSGPEYVWTRQPGPPGAPGPIWCLTVQPLPNRPIMVSPERYGWVRVLCGDQATPPRIARLQRGLHARGLYRGEIDGRYDEETAFAVRRFQQEGHIEHRGYLSYETEAAIDEPPPPPRPRPQLTTFDTGYIDWPGKVGY